MASSEGLSVAEDGAQHELRTLPGVPENCPLRFQQSSQLGRFLVADRDLTEGEILLREAPLVIGPQHDSTPICLGCHRPLGLLPPLLCSKCCTAQLCSASCETSKHHVAECAAFKQALPLSSDLLHQDSNWQVILPLRCFVNQLKALTTLDSHIEKRRNTQVWVDTGRNIVNVLHNHGLLRNYPEEALQRICGILDANSFEVRSPPDETGRTECLRGIYPNSSYMKHSCISNTHIAIDNNFNLIMKSAKKISKGDIIYYNYSDTLMCTAMRRECLRMGKYFECECQRCSDPTELGSHLSSLRCPKVSCTGAVLCTSPLISSYEAEWKCNKCLGVLDALTVQQGLLDIQQELALMDRTNAKSLEVLITKLQRSLHPNHSIMLEVIQALSGIYREQIVDMGPNIVSTALLKRKLELCEALLPVVELLEPPMSRLKGITLYEIAAPLAALSQNEQNSEVRNKQLTRAEEQLRESARLLLQEPPGAPEAQLAKVALMELKGVRQQIADLAKAAKKAKSKAARKKK